MDINEYETYSLTFNSLRTVPDNLLSNEPYVNIGALFTSGGGFLGSGFYLATGHFVTAGHVCLGHDHIEARFLDSDIPLILSDRYDIGPDLIAYAVGPVTGRPGFIIGYPEASTKVWVLGFPLKDGGRAISISHGNIISIQEYTFDHDASTVDHQSGGPVIDVNNISTVYGVVLEQLNVLNVNRAGVLKSANILK